MTRCSDLGLTLLLMLAGMPGLADTLVSDAFGLFDPATTAPERRDWAGWTGAGVVVAPLDPDRLVIFAGPKSMVAGKDPGHVMAMVVDRFGNLVADGTAATVTVAGAATPGQTAGGIADLLVPPQSRAGVLFVGVTSGGRQSPQAMLGITADIASIRPDIPGAVADARADTEFVLTSSPMDDRFGNPVPDGTGVTTVLRHADGSYSIAQGMALQDQSLARFIARDMPGAVEATITLGTKTSEAAAFSVLAPVSAGLPPLEVESLPDIDALRLTLGPFLTTDGYALTDGAQVTVTANLVSGPPVTGTAWVLDGEVSLLLPVTASSPVLRLTVASPLGAMDLTPDWRAAVAAEASTRISP